MQQGYKVLICLDTNKNMINGRIVKIFKEIRLTESTSFFHSRAPPAMFVEGRYQIDRVWSSLRLRPCTASIAPFYLGVGDHRIFIVNFPKELIIGEGFVPIYKPSIRRLISYQPKAILTYIERGESLFK